MVVEIEFFVLVFFFSSRGRHMMSGIDAWVRRCSYETGVVCLGSVLCFWCLCCVPGVCVVCLVSVLCAWCLCCEPGFYVQCLLPVFYSWFLCGCLGAFFMRLCHLYFCLTCSWLDSWCYTLNVSHQITLHYLFRT